MSLSNTSTLILSAAVSFSPSGVRERVKGFRRPSPSTVGLAVHGIRKEPQLERPYFGFNFSEEDKKNLRETGNMGRAVELNLRGSEYTPCLILSLIHI